MLHRTGALIAPIFSSLALAASVYAQTPDPPAPSFDLASIKPATMPVRFSGHVGVRIDADHGLFGCDYCAPKMLIQFAWSLKNYQFDGPDSLDDQPYVIEARMPPGASIDQIKIMMQHLLAERWALKHHSEQRTLPVFDLVPEPKGARLTQAAPDERPGARTGTASLMLTKTSLAGLASSLEKLAGRPVMARDDSPLRYNFDLQWPPASPGDPTIATAVFSVLQEKYGLILKPGRATIEVFVVDKISKNPASN